MAIPEVLVICRPEDVHPDAERSAGASASHLGPLTHQEVRYHFLDIWEWTISQLDRMSPDARGTFHQKLHEDVADPNTSEKLKRAWARLHSA